MNAEVEEFKIVKGTLIKMAGTQQLRTDKVAGYFEKMPIPGQRFRMIAESLDPAMDFRVVLTSKVVEIQLVSSRIRQFKTETGSLYMLEFGPDA